MSSSKSRPSRATRTKLETESELHQVATASRNRGSVTPKEAAAKVTSAANTRKAVESVSVDTAVKQVTELGLQVNRSLAQLAEQLSNKVTEYQVITEAVKLEKEELERLHGVDIVASSVDDMVATYDTRNQELEALYGTRNQQLREKQSAFERQLSDDNAQSLKRREQAEADYVYARQQFEKKETDAFVEKMRTQHLVNTDKQAALEKEWLTREEMLQAQEKEVTQLRADVAAYPETMKKEVEKGIAIATNSVKRDYTHQLEVARMQSESDRRAADLEIKSHVSSSTRQQATIDALQSQLAAAQKQVQEIAGKALESASGSRTLAEMTAFAANRNEPSRNGKST